MLSHDDIGSLQKTLDDLYSKLNAAYWAASTVEGKDEIHGAIDVVNGVLDQLDKAGLQSDNDAIKVLTDSLQVVNKDIGDLQSQLSAIVHNVTVASEVVGAIDAAITIVGKITAIA
jgi:hypothetical protein